MLKTLHWCALRITDLAYLVVRLGDHLWELGGSLEAWCDTRIYERERQARIKQWQQWMEEL